MSNDVRASCILALLIYLTSCSAITFPVSIAASIADQQSLITEAEFRPSRTNCEEGERMMYWGLLLIVIGIVLTPIGIGIPILVLGKIILVCGLIMYLWQMATC
jgi:hypothetical protein